MPEFIDQTGRSVSIAPSPKRIISLVPSQTELLYDLQLGDRVVGITKFCIHPTEWFRHKQRVGGTKTINIPIIQTLRPDLIIANKEENVKEQVNELCNHFPVWVSDINTLHDATSMIHSLGEICACDSVASEITKKIERGFDSFHPRKNKPSVVYMIWRDPYMTVGGDTFINDILLRCGFNNLFTGELRYPEVSIQTLVDLRPSFILLSSEPYPFKQKHIDELQTHLPDSKIMLVDGEMFSWYGSRLIKSANYLSELLRSIDKR